MHNRTPSQHHPDPAKGVAREGQTRPARGAVEQSSPRMPHERDESADSQAADEPSDRRMGRLAQEDIERGVVDTDKGPPLNETYEKLRQDMPDGEKKFSP